MSARTFALTSGGVTFEVDAYYHGPLDPYFELTAVRCPDDLKHVLKGNVLATLEEKLADLADREASWCRAERRAPEYS